ncbi:MAG: cyclic nucleotide-binding domain-containing protein [Acidobacteriota bacterium]
MSAFWDSMVHVSYVLLLIAYLVHDVLKLRALAFLSTGAWVSYCAVQSPTLWEPLLWSVTFMLVNAVQIARLLRERRAIRFTEEERDLYETVFSNFSGVEFMRLLQFASWRDAPAGEVLVSEGEVPEGVMYLSRGGARVESHHRERAHLRPLSFVAEMSYVSGAPASATVQLTEPSRYLLWTRNDLDALFAKHPSIRSAFQSVVGADLARKLQLHDEDDSE